MFQKEIFSLVRKLNQGVLFCKCKSSLPMQWKQFDDKDVKNHVANIFLCKQKEADALVESMKDQFAVDRCGRIEILRALRMKGLNMKNVMSCKNILNQPYVSIMERIQFSTAVLQDDSPSTIISVLRLNGRNLGKIQQLISTENKKIEECSTLFKCSKIESCMLFIKCPFLLRSKSSTLKRKIELLEKNLLVDDIKKDLWVLTYTMEKLENRIEEIKSMNIHPIKPWMLRCLPEVLLRTYSNRQENQAALGSHPNVVAYLADRLDVDEEDINLFAKKHPPVMRVQVAKIKEMVHYLLSEGYPTAKILQTPRILCHSLETIQGRMNDLKKRTYQPKVLSILCKSKRSFATFVEKVDRYKEHAEQTQ